MCPIAWVLSHHPEHNPEDTDLAVGDISGGGGDGNVLMG